MGFKRTNAHLIYPFSGVEYDRFVSDYRGIMGELPPFKKLGFQDLEHLLRSIPDTVIIERGYDGCILKVNLPLFYPCNAGYCIGCCEINLCVTIFLIHDFNV